MFKKGSKWYLLLFSLKLINFSLNFVFRLGTANYGLRQWKKASGYYEELLRKFPETKTDAHEQILRSEQRINESKTGAFDIAKLYDEVYEKRNRRLDVADYKGPIKVADVPGKGKGLVATRDITQGTLLLVDKAFVISYPDEHQIEGDSIFLAIATNRIGKKDQSLTFQEAINKLRIMPTKTTEFYNLYAGSDYPRTTSGSDQLPTGWHFYTFAIIFI